MAQTIHLNGGPWHGRVTALEDGRDHFHIIEPVEDVVARELNMPHPEGEFATVTTREGMYSQVHDINSRPIKGEFEWDGWRSHD
ncbi:hypothetical protein IXEL_48 [Microbacterium phage Ixel]|nr:hypothetical protein IXEL_48 [Microbacterium phage Ixel]